MDLLGTFDDPDDRVARRPPSGALARPLVGLVAAGLLFCLALGLAAAGVAFAADRLGHPRHPRVRRCARRRSSSVGARSARGRPTRTGVDRPLLEAPRLLGRRRRARPLLPVHGHLLPLGSVGDALRRGRARDARARRLDQPLVGAGRLVLEQAGPRHVDAGDRDGDARRPLPARQDAHRRRHAARSCTPSGPCARRSCS